MTAHSVSLTQPTHRNPLYSLFCASVIHTSEGQVYLEKIKQYWIGVNKINNSRPQPCFELTKFNLEYNGMNYGKILSKCREYFCPKTKTVELK